MQRVKNNHPPCQQGESIWWVIGNVVLLACALFFGLFGQMLFQ